MKYDREALDLAIEALRGDFHCPKCGTIVRNGRQYHDLVYRGEAEVDTSTNTSTDLISRQAAIEAVEKAVFKGVAKSAIESLPPVEQKPVCEDAISRGWILKELNAESEKDYPSFRRVMEKIEDAPPVEPERPKGEWNPYYTEREHNDVFNCKLCGKTFIVIQGNDNMNFCPNCGADMRGKKND